MIRVVVVEDHHLVRQGICSLLERAEDIVVVGEAADGIEAVEMAQREKPDVVVMDIVMPRMNGTQAIERLRAIQRPPRIVILSMYSDETLIQQCLRNGATGFLLKRSVVEELLLAVRAAARGETFLSPSISSMILRGALASSEGDSGESGIESLSGRELEVLQLVAEGHTNASIGEILSISPKTVEKHRASLMTKLDLHDMAGLIRFAIKNGVIQLDE
jgi:DNA-binding NarL/FixJ family response regulator